MDVRINPEAPSIPQDLSFRREDYLPPDWLVPDIELDFMLDPDGTLVRATLTVVRNGDHDRPLRLNGDELAPLRVAINGEAAEWRMDGADLLLDIEAERATVETEVLNR